MAGNSPPVEIGDSLRFRVSDAGLSMFNGSKGECQVDHIRVGDERIFLTRERAFENDDNCFEYAFRLDDAILVKNGSYHVCYRDSLNGGEWITLSVELLDLEERLDKSKE